MLLANNDQQNKYYQVWTEILKIINGGQGELISLVIYGVFWHTWGRAKLNFSNLIKDLIPLKTLTYKKH